MHFTIFNQLLLENSDDLMKIVSEADIKTTYSLCRFYRPGIDVTHIKSLVNIKTNLIATNYFKHLQESPKLRLTCKQHDQKTERLKTNDVSLNYRAGCVHLDHRKNSRTFQSGVFLPEYIYFSRGKDTFSRRLFA